MAIIIGVLALQGAFLEHIVLLRKAILSLDLETITGPSSVTNPHDISCIEVRTAEQLRTCSALIIPGGESTTISLIASRGGLLEPLRDFVKVERKPVWGTCAGLILLAEAANATKKGGQDLIGGLDVRVNRNHFGRQIESFVADLNLPFLANTVLDGKSPYPGVFIRAPIVERILPNVEGAQLDESSKTDTVVAPARLAKTEQAKSVMSAKVEVLGVLPGRVRKAADAGALVDASDEAGDIIAVRQGNVFGTSFHPELTSDVRIHTWWLQQVLDAVSHQTSVESFTEPA